MNSPLSSLGSLLPSQVNVSAAVIPNLLSDGPGVGSPSYIDLTIEDSSGVLNGSFDSFCIDSDRSLSFARFDLDNDGVYNETGVPVPSLGGGNFDEGEPIPFSASVYSSYDQTVLGDGLGGLIEQPENLDLVNWILNNQEGALAGFNAAEIQLAIWELVDDSPIDSSTESVLGFFTGQSDPANVEAIKSLAQQNGDGFVPQAGQKVAVILVPDGNGAGGTSDTDADGQPDGTPDAQIIIAAVELSALGDTVFEDLDADGIQEAGEQGIAGATVNLLADIDGDGDIEANEVVDTTTTDANGNYQFTVLPGDYQVQFETADGFAMASPANQGSDDAVDSDGPISDVVSLAPGEVDPTIDAGFFKKASLGDRVFLDADRDGIQDADEAGVEGVTVTLTGGGADGVIGTADDTTATTTTDADGNYLFDDLNPGEQYKVTFSDLPTGFEFTTQNAGNGAPGSAADAADSDADPITGMSQVVTLQSGEFNPTLDAGIVEQLAALGDTVFLDADRDGIQDDGEAGVEGVTVTLTGAGADGESGTADDITDTTTTDANGEYAFTELAAGDYKVTFSDLPTGFEFTTQDAGGDDALDSDADPTTGMSQVVTLNPGEFNPTLDAGIVEQLAGLGDKVFEDTNRNGIQDAGEAGVANVTVELTGAGADGEFGTADDVTDTTTTDGNGEYAFTELAAGDYKVTFSDLPEDFVFTAQDAGDDAIDSDADPTTGMSQVVNLSPGEFDPTIDAGIFKLNEGIDIEKFVNGVDADTAAEAVEIAAGEQVVFTYEVTNTGEVAFAASDVVVTDDNGTADDTNDDFNPTFIGGDANGNNQLDVGETWLYSETQTAQDLDTVIDFEGFAAGTVLTNQYADLGITISATGGSGDAMIFDSANPTGGDTDLATSNQGNILIISEDGDSSEPDDNWRGGTLAFDFANAADVESISFVDIEEAGGTISSFDAAGNLIDSQAIAVNGNNGQSTIAVNDENVSRLEVALVGSGSISGLRLGGGLYKNVGTVLAGSVSDEDHATYQNPDVAPEPGITIEKFVNGANADTAAEAVEIAAGEEVTFTYAVSNLGNVAFDASEVVVTDDNGTASNTGDDFNPAFVGGDLNSNNRLDAGETWLYSQSEAAQNLTTVTSTEDVRFVFDGNSSLDGPNGNVRTFTAGDVSVDVSAFRSDKSGNHFDAAYVGAYNGGLGVTNRYEGTSGHRVDNGGSLDYLVFKFGQDVTVDRAFLDYVGHDSDISVWIGDHDGNDISSLNGSLLNDFTQENNFTNHGYSRWADFNSDELAGDTVIISAHTGGSNDSFKLRKLDVSVAGETTIGNYQNVATVTAQTLSAADAGNYTNPAAAEPVHFLYEAEDMHLNGYRVEHLGAHIASGGEAIKLSRHDGSASVNFDGPTGDYDIIVGYFDESDGESMAKVKVGGHTVGNWTFDELLGSNFASSSNFREFAIEDVHIEAGESIKLSGWFDHSEFARFDYVKVVSADGNLGSGSGQSASTLGDSDLFNYLNNQAPSLVSAGVVTDALI